MIDSKYPTYIGVATIVSVALAALGLAAPARAGAGQPATFKGTLFVGHRDDLKRHRSVPYYSVSTPRRKGRPGRNYTLRFTGKRARRFAHTALADPAQYSGVKVTLRGKRSRTRIRVARVTSVQPRARAAAVTPNGPRKVAAIMVNFRDRTEAWNPANVRAKLFTGPRSANAFFKEGSNNVVSLVGRDRSDGDVYGPVNIDYDEEPCDIYTWLSAAKSEAMRQGADLGGYDHVAIMLPGGVCGSGGAGQVDGDTTWIGYGNTGDGGIIAPGIAAHEFGHNFGLGHGSQMECTRDGQRVTISRDCQIVEYGDPFDVMGSGFNHFNATHKASLGWLSGTQETLSADATRTIAPATPGTGGLQRLRIVRTTGLTGIASSWFDIDFRQPHGAFDDFPAGAPIVNGVSIRVIHRNSTTTNLLDTTPLTSGALDSPLTAGRTFTDPYSTVSITVNSALPSGASVTVGGTSEPPIDATGYVYISGSTLAYEAGSANNAVTVSRQGDMISLDDPDRYLVPGPGCTIPSPGRASCSASGVRAVRVIAGDGDDSVTIDPSVDSSISAELFGGDGTDTLVGADGSDKFEGGPGMDTLLGFGGADTLDGGAPGDDEDYDPGDGSATDTLIGYGGNDTIYGRAGADNILGLDDDDKLYGGGGDDIVGPGQGEDVVDGGNGFDSSGYWDRPERVTVKLDDRRNDGGFGEHDNIMSNVESVTGGNGNDKLYGGDGPNTLDGSGGNDYLKGYEGSDLLLGGDGDDKFYGGKGTGIDTVSYANYNDSVTVTIGSGRDDGRSGEADDVKRDVENLLGGTGQDTLTGSRYDNMLTGGLGADTIRGGSGQDTAGFQDHAANQPVVAAIGRGGPPYEDSIDNDVENLLGGNGADILYGNETPNVIDGADGIDVLQGGLGADTLKGGQHGDTVNYSERTASQPITYTDDTLANDGEAGEGDNVGHDVESVVGGAGEDWLYSYAADGSIAANGGELHGGPGNDHLFGDSSTLFGVSNILFGESGNDTLDASRGGSAVLYGGSEHDTLIGGSSPDLLSGESGSDILDSGRGGVFDTVDGGPDDDTVDFSTRTSSVAIDLNIERQSLAGEFLALIAIENVTGGAGADTLIGDDLGNVIFGEGGADTLSGRGGVDTLNARDGLADTSLDCGPDPDFLIADAVDPFAPGCEARF